MESDVGTETRTPLGPLAPSQQNGDGAAPDFSKLTTSQFGITSSSFTTFPKDKSRVAQLKARRRSSIGVRGSPETNSLICFRAKQHLLESPLFSGRDSIKQKMAAFQRLMGIDEDDTAMKMKEEEEGAGRTQSDVGVGPEERENRLAPVTPPQAKRRRRGTPHRRVWEGQIDQEPTVTHTPKNEQEADFKSPEMPPSPGLGLDSQSQLMSFPMLSKPELIKTGDPEVSSVSRKKRVRFGAPLSPEFFDRSLPPSTPLQKGATPACPPSSTGRKHSLLKTPQRFEPVPQPDFSSPAGNGASPVLNTHSYSEPGDADEVFLDCQKIAFPIMDEEYDNPLVDNTASAEIEFAANHEPVENRTETSSAEVHQDEGGSLSFTRPDQPLTAEPEPRIELKDQRSPLEPVEESTQAPRSRGRKRKQPAKCETTETRRSSRSAAESAKGKMKTTSAKKRFGTKEVDRSLYGKRDYASKNPHLSPIIESRTSSLSCTPTQPHENPDYCPAKAFNTNRSESASPGATADLVAAAALWRSRFLHHTENAESADQSAGSEQPALTVQLETTVKSEDGRARAGRPARGRRNSAGRSWGGARAKGGAQKSESKQEEGKSERRGRKRSGTRTSSVVETCEGTVECSSLEKMVEDTREKVEEENLEDETQTSGREEVKKGNEGVKEDEAETIHGDISASETLEDWQQPDFCIEDILKPVATSRGSVRRSLRNRRSMDVVAKGLAWVEHTSPQMAGTNPRKKTRGRLSAVSQTPPFPDETPTFP